MSVKIYRKSDLKIVSTVPVGISPERDFELNVGGNVEDYGFIEVTIPYFRLERVKGEVVAVEIEAPPSPPEPPQPPTETEILMDYVVNVDYRVTALELGII
ncbi:hypothetical protein [Cytobacillus solani]|uniref:Uncharacterized protein n=1 Tax=Cytobacillus solani TaxID=1637975 RepID=A0A0Q3QQM2_9BACI|nr:hypothetical protein [Cytobacillus solani]KQL20465.1 hypothetical protein AN957_18985 [Cytobacillus solani]